MLEKKIETPENFWHSCPQRAWMEFLIQVMSLSRFSIVVFDIVTICLVSIVILFGLICIAASFYYLHRIHNQGFVHLNFFSGPWIIRIAFILFVIWWSLGEIIRLTLLRHALHLNLWSEIVCKCYIVWNMGFVEPCLFLTIVFLLRAPLQRLEIGIMSIKWNMITFGYIILYCLPPLIVQVFVVFVGPQLEENNGLGKKLPHYFTSTISSSSRERENDDITICTYPLLSTALLGLFAMILTSYLSWLGSRILKLVINKGLRKRVYTLLFPVLCFLPLRVLFLGLSVLSRPEHFMFEAFVFLAFLALVHCFGLCMWTLVYRPIVDCLALVNLQDSEARTRRSNDDSVEEDSFAESVRSTPYRDFN
ncbi:hypothetical protein MtrunA17_Chr4g0042541 [Medicago truncatula]|uniref:Transmembrane protein, putative n=1 Tax=Medicago truncatula TaxID=3880 RepID=G7JG81_MEDTR|nr:transmembrane protein, putative [Medicago truncatula]RHN61986.1 hypothetical protein MtrunA17_Chr4g0042541 [Medicago truncatula]